MTRMPKSLHVDESRRTFQQECFVRHCRTRRTVTEIQKQKKYASACRGVIVNEGL
jgi:hypothetical protein